MALAWEDEFDGTSLDSKWTEYHLSASCSATVAGGVLRLAADGPADAADTQAMVFQINADLPDFPCAFEVSVECENYLDEDPTPSDFSFYIMYANAVFSGLLGGVGVLWQSGGWVQSRSYDTDGNRYKYDPVPYTYGGNILLRIYFGADGVPYVAYKGETDDDFVMMDMPSFVPIFSGETNMDIMITAGSKANDQAHVWNVDYIRKIDVDSIQAIANGFQGFDAFKVFSGFKGF